MGLFDEKETATVFEFGIEEEAKVYMLQTARWTMFLSIIGLISVLFFFLGAIGLFFYSSGNGLLSQYLIVMYLVLCLLYVYPVISLMRFSSNIRYAMNHSDKVRFNAAMRHQRNLYAYIGILIIFVIAVYGIIIATAGLRGLF